MDIDSEHFWEFIAGEVAAVINYGLHCEEEWNKLKAENRKLDDELRDARGQIRHLSFAQRLHNIVHSTWSSTAPSKLYDSSPSLEPMRQAESAQTKPEVLESSPDSGTSGSVQAQIDRIRRKTTSSPTKQLTARGETETETRAARRRAFIDPILKSKGLSVYRWEKDAGVSSKVGQRYLDGLTTPRPEQALKLARALGLEQLPE